MSSIDFGLGLLRLYAGAKFDQLALREDDHNRPYAGKKIPLCVTISSTYHCNLKCAHCQAENDNARQDIPTERMLGLIDEIADAGGVKIGFTGGEPMMKSDFGLIIERCRKRKLIISVVANGWYVKRNIETLKGVHLLFLSLDGDREIHDRVRGPGNFDKFLESVAAAREIGVPVAALTTLMSMNFPRLKAMAEIIEEQRLHWMVALIQTAFTRRTEQDLTSEQVREAMAVVSASRNLRTSGKYLRFVLEGKPMARCFAGIGYCIIAPNGMIYPCFPAQFDHEDYNGVAYREIHREPAPYDSGPHGPYQGVSILDKDFGRAYQELVLYRKTCAACALACHAESNYLYEFDWDSIRQAFKLMKPI